MPSRVAPGLVLCAAVLAYAFWAVFPLSWDMLRGGPSTSMIGDGTDARGLLWSYEIVQRTWREHPSWMLYGAIFTDLRDLPTGGGLWVPFNERLLVPLLALVAKDGHLATAMALALMTLNGLSVGYMGEKLRWNRAVTLAVALAFAVNPYTRARAAVHMALVGYYWLPLAIGATVGLATTDAALSASTRFRKYAEYTFVLLLCATVAHYYLIIFALVTPWLLYLYVKKSVSLRPKTLFFAAVCAIPAISALAWQIARPLPSGVAPTATAVPIPDRELARSYVRACGAEPWNYITGDIKFGAADINPLRELANRLVYSPDQSRNPHERSNGIRWSAFVALIVSFATWKRRSPRPPASPTTRAWLVLAIAGFLCAMSPEFLLPKSLESFTPAMVINDFIPQFRVPSRIGPAFHLAILLMFGDFMTRLMEQEGRWSHVLAWVLPLSVVIEGTPLSPMMRAPLHPVQSALVRHDGNCGAGLALPFAVADYWAFEDTRGTKCQLANPLSAIDGTKVETLVGAEAMSARGATASAALFAECMGLSWFLMRPALHGASGNALCTALGWEMKGENVCLRPSTRPISGRTVAECGAQAGTSPVVP